MTSHSCCWLLAGTKKCCFFFVFFKRNYSINSPIYKVHLCKYYSWYNIFVRFFKLKLWWIQGHFDRHNKGSWIFYYGLLIQYIVRIIYTITYYTIPQCSEHVLCSSENIPFIHVCLFCPQFFYKTKFVAVPLDTTSSYLFYKRLTSVSFYSTSYRYLTMPILIIKYSSLLSNITLTTVYNILAKVVILSNGV